MDTEHSCLDWLSGYLWFLLLGGQYSGRSPSQQYLLLRYSLFLWKQLVRMKKIHGGPNDKSQNVLPLEILIPKKKYLCVMKSKNMSVQNNLAEMYEESMETLLSMPIESFECMK